MKTNPERKSHDRISHFFLNSQFMVEFIATKRSYLKANNLDLFNFAEKMKFDTRNAVFTHHKHLVFNISCSLFHVFLDLLAWFVVKRKLFCVGRNRFYR